MLQVTAIAECGTGKTLISLGAMYVHAKGRPFTALVMVPPQLTMKWCRECLLTLPRVRVFLIDGVRNGVGSNGHTGVNEVRLRNGRIVREGLQTTLSELRLHNRSKSARRRWAELCDCPAIFDPSKVWSGRIVNLKPRPGEMAFYGIERDPATNAMRSDRALVTFMPGMDEGARVAVFAGLTTTGTEAALHFATSAAGVSEWINRLGKADAAGRLVLPRYFQSVVRAEVVRGEILRVQYEAGRVIER